jgi:hypothetical protein
MVIFQMVALKLNSDGSPVLQSLGKNLQSYQYKVLIGDKFFWNYEKAVACIQEKSHAPQEGRKSINLKLILGIVLIYSKYMKPAVGIAYETIFQIAQLHMPIIYEPGTVASKIRFEFCIIWSQKIKKKSRAQLPKFDCKNSR